MGLVGRKCSPTQASGSPGGGGSSMPRPHGSQPGFRPWHWALAPLPGPLTLLYLLEITHLEMAQDPRVTPGGPPGTSVSQ